MSFHKENSGKELQGSSILNLLTLLFLIVIWISAVFSHNSILQTTSMTVYFFILGWLAIAIIFCVVSRYRFVPGYLIYIFAFLIAWRLTGLNRLAHLSYPLFLVFILIYLNFLYCAINNLKYPNQYRHAMSMEAWQLTFIRLYIGFNFVPHFSEKLFAGTAIRSIDVSAFSHLGVIDPTFLVWLAGMCEFGAAVAIALGFLMRLGALGAILYLLIATYLGHHFSLGFIWAGAGGGWEYAVMWTVLIGVFAVSDKHPFSIDQYLQDHFNLPKWLKKLM